MRQETSQSRSNWERIILSKLYVVRMCVCLCVFVCACLVAAGFTWQQEPGALCRDKRRRSKTEPVKRSLSAIFPGLCPVWWHIRAVPCCFQAAQRCQRRRTSMKWCGYWLYFDEEKKKKKGAVESYGCYRQHFCNIAPLGRRGQARCQVGRNLILCVFFILFYFVFLMLSTWKQTLMDNTLTQSRDTQSPPCFFIFIFSVSL